MSNSPPHRPAKRSKPNNDVSETVPDWFYNLVHLPDSASDDAREIEILLCKRAVSITYGFQPALGGTRANGRPNLPIDLESALVFQRGQIRNPPCKKHKCSGPFNECVTLNGYLGNACVNCAYNDKGQRCSFWCEFYL
jgi:hypothetical protein